MSERLNIVSAYFDAAKNRPEKCVEFVSDKISLNSERDGLINGIESFRQYSARTRLEGCWERPEMHPIRSDVIFVRGKILKFMKLINIITVFVFEEETDKILKIIAGRIDNVKIPEKDC